jgi:hypothetical protein
MLLILEKHGDRKARGLEGGREAYAAMQRYAERLKNHGLLSAASALRTDEHGVRLTQKSGKATIVDGPFTESKEMIGGFFLIDCKTKDEAIALAQECPAAAWATVEVRETGTCFEDLA